MEYLDNRVCQKIIIVQASSGLGFKLIGGFKRSDSDSVYGIFVRKVFPDGLAAKHSSIKVGNQILQVNGISLKDSSFSRALDLLNKASATDNVELIISNDVQSRSEYAEVLSLKQKMKNSLNISDITQSKRVYENATTETVASVLKKINIQKCQDDLGLKMSTSSIEYQGKRLLQVKEISASGSVEADGRLKIGDCIVKYNHVGVSDWTPEELESMFVQERLQPTSSIHIEYIPAEESCRLDYDEKFSLTQPTVSKCIGQNEAVAITNTVKLQEKTCSQRNMNLCKQPDLSTTFQPPPMSLTTITPMPKYKVVLSPSTPVNGLGNLHSKFRKLSLEEDSCVELSKLHKALEYFGIKSSEKEKNQLKKMVKKDSKGSVRFKDFVNAVKIVFHDHLKNLQLNNTTFGFANADHVSFKPGGDLYSKQHTKQNLSTADRLLQEIGNLHTAVCQKNKENEDLKKELQRTHKKSTNTDESTPRYEQLKDESSTKSVRPSNNHDETEVASREENIGPERVESTTELQKAFDDLEEMRIRASLVDCEYRKSSEIRKIRDEALHSLIHFIEKLISTGRSATEENALAELTKLVDEACSTMAMVRPSIVMEELPYGWEEAHLPDGSKYFVNHSDCTTSWIDPREAEDSFDGDENGEEDSKDDAVSL